MNVQKGNIYLEKNFCNSINNMSLLSLWINLSLLNKNIFQEKKNYKNGIAHIQEFSSQLFIYLFN